MRKFALLNGLWFLGVALPCLAAGPVTNVVFYDDFEASMGNWTPTGTSPLDWSVAQNIVPTGKLKSCWGSWVGPSLPARSRAGSRFCDQPNNVLRDKQIMWGACL